MSGLAKSEGLFSLPSTANKARQVFYAMMLAGVALLPMLLAVYHRFFEPKATLTLREFFVIFTVFYLLLFSFFTGRARSSATALRKCFDGSLARDVAVVAPAAANSGQPKTVELGRKYWFWQLVSSYFSGVGFSWVGCMFILFVV